ncbi:MAG: zinc-binding dehydrogenase [Dehalococcoidia bacterium]|nr:zinc-binding dehydrogenase [Dehalococcoidia bacterium]
MKSRAAIHVGHGKELVVDEINIPDPQPDQVIVKLYSSGVCASQLHQMHNPDTPTPGLLGHEGFGIVTQIGSDITHLKVGDAAIVTWVPREPVPGRWLAPSAGVTWNETPLEGSTFTWCEDAIVWGGYAVKVDNDAPKDLSSIVGCAILTGAGAVTHTAKVRPGESVAVFGVGGVGLSAIQMAAVVNAYPIIAVDIDDEKLKFAKKFGATHTVNSAKVDPIATVIEMTNGGVDYAFDAVGLRITNEQILPVTRSGGSGADNIGGMAVMIGMPGPEMTLWPGHFMFHQRQYRGSLGATYPDKDFNMYLRLYKEGKFPLDKLVTKRYKLDDINEACDDLQSGKILGRAILEF